MDIIQDMVIMEKKRCLEFADANPEIVLPENLDDIDVFNDCSVVSKSIALPSSDGTAELEVNSPALNTKRKPCGLSHPFKIK